MSSASLRPAGDADVGAIASIWHDAWHDAHDAHVPAGLVDDRPLLYFTGRAPDLIARSTIAEDASGIVGFVTVSDDELDLLFVAVRARGSGVAGALLTDGERQIAARFDTAWLEVVTGNARARAFYARQGWRDTGPADHMVDTSGGRVLVASHHYEKWLR
jgi:putative acetyltransferase